MAQESQLKKELPQNAYAGFWFRFLAYFLDNLIILLPTAALNVGAVAIAGSDKTPQYFLLYLAATLLFGVTYYGLFQAHFRGTFGKKICGLMLISDDGETAGLGQAIGRYFMWGVSATVLFLGIFWVGFDKYKQGWHDKVAGTLVVKKEAYEAWKAKTDTHSVGETHGFKQAA